MSFGRMGARGGFGGLGSLGGTHIFGAPKAVATRGRIGINASAAISTASQLRRIYRMRHYMAGTAIKRVKFVDGNYYCLTTSGQLNPGNARNLQRSMEIPGVGVKRVTWSASNTVALSDGLASIESDWVNASDFPGLSQFDPNLQFWLRASDDIASGGKFITFPGCDSGITGESAVQCNVSDDPQLDTTGTLTATGNYVTIGNASGLVPLVIIGETVSGLHIVSCVAIGSSILAGNNDSPNVGDGVDGKGGYFQRAFANVGGNHLPYSNLSSAGENGINFILDTKRQAVLKYFTHALCDFDSNGMAAGITGAAAYGNCQTIYAACRAAGIQRVEQVNIQPRTTSTDNWTTVANQTPITGFAIGGNKRDAFQTLVLAGVGTATGADAFLDLSIATQSLSATDKWLTDEATATYSTTDGVHPNGTPSTRGHAVMAPLLATRAATWVAP